jgi:hypothetical protein
MDVAHKNAVMTCFMLMLKWSSKLSSINDGYNLSNCQLLYMAGVTTQVAKPLLFEMKVL